MADRLKSCKRDVSMSHILTTIFRITVIKIYQWFNLVPQHCLSNKSYEYRNKMTFSAKSSLILPWNKADFPREGHINV